MPWARTLDCASGSDCVVVDERGRFTTWNGSTWSSRSTFDNTRGGVRDLECTSSVDCVATDGFGNVLRWSGGSSWALSILSEGPSALDCAGSFCLSWDEWTSTWRTRTGGTWSGTHPPVNLQAAVVVCASSTRCFAPGDGTVAAFTGSSWQSPTPLPVDLGQYWITGGDCPTSTFCVLVGANGRSVSWNGATWVNRGTVPVEPGIPVAVDCVTPTFCMATAGMRSATWNGSRWQAADDVWGDARTVSCTSTTRCFAVAYGRLHAWDGQQWAETTTDFGWTTEPAELRCLPAGRCVLLQGDHAWWTT